MARAASIRHSQHGDGASFASKATTRPPNYEEEIARSGVYRRMASGPISEEPDKADIAFESLRVGQTLLAVQEHDNSLPGHLKISPGEFVKIKKKVQKGFWFGEVLGKQGYFPISCCDVDTPLVEETIPAAKTQPNRRNISAIHSFSKPHQQNLIVDQQAESERLLVQCRNDLKAMHSNHGLDFLPIRFPQLEKLRDTQGRNVLHYLGPASPKIHWHDFDCFVKRLIEAGADINAQSDNGETPLMSVLKDEGSIWDSLLRVGALLDTVSKTTGETALHVAARYRSDRTVASLLDKGLFVDAKDFEWNTPLHAAALGNQKNGVSQLLHAKASINTRNRARQTPLYVAAANGCAAASQMLLDKRADASLCAFDNISPLHAAAMAGHSDVCYDILRRHKNEPLCQDEKGRTALHFAVEGKVHMIFLNRIGVTLRRDELERKTKTGMTPLHTAIDLGYDRGGEDLIDNGADVRAFDNKGWTPLYYAAYRGHVRVAHMLLNHGGKDLCMNTPKHNPVVDAESNPVQNTEPEIVSRELTYLPLLYIVLLAALLQIRFLPWFLFWPVFAFLVWVFYICKTAIVPSPVAPLPDASLPDTPLPIVPSPVVPTPIEPSETVLHVAARKDRRSIVHLLLDIGMPLEGRNKDGWTALQLARKNGHDEMVKLLTDAGAMPYLP